MIALMALALTPAPVLAGMKEAKAAYEAKNYKTAFKEYLPLAEAGNAEAQYRIGRMYRFGLGRNQNYDKAMFWFKKAVKSGYRPMMITLGYMIGRGQGVKASKEAEICFYRLEAERGNKMAQWSLYLSLPVNKFTLEENKFWLNRAVNQGVPAAMAHKGKIIIQNSMDFNKSKGLMYLVLAQKYGDDPEVDEFIEETVADNPTRKKQLEKAKAMAAKWKPVKEVPPADLAPMDFEKCFSK